MCEANRKFRDHHGKSVRVIRWEHEMNRVIYLREDYPHEYLSPLDQFQRKFGGVEGGHKQ